MIYFILDKNNSFTIRNYRNFRGREIADRIGIVLYQEIEKLEGKKAAAVIFSDLDRMNRKQLQLVQKLAADLKRIHPDLKILNDPDKVLRRYELLRTLYQKGFNTYNVWRLSEPRGKIRFPVFLREENYHTGALTGLIYTDRELRRNILSKLLLGYRFSELLIVEFCDISDGQGLRNKYSAVYVNGTVIPRYFELSKKWMVKSDDDLADIPVQQRMEKYWEYLGQNPHREWLEEIFRIAGIDYGRIDYGVDNSGKTIRKEVWEINLNPAYYGHTKTVSREIDRIYEFSHQRMRDRFIQLDSCNPFQIHIGIPPGTGKLFCHNVFREGVRIFHDNFNTKRRTFQWGLKVLNTIALGLAGFLLFFSRTGKGNRL